ncbi:MAG: hypothetical protein H0T42_05300 [Deltaproteobacteria bacterium]|nr:hypothetical protein [Deltaproteobacteria bacterium]
MRRGLFWIGVLAMGCWTSAPGPAPVTTARTDQNSSATRALASELADELRDAEDSMFVDRFVERQLVVLEPESGTIQILCDAQTLTASVRFSELLNDPDRPPPRCVSAAGFVCTQGVGPDLLWLDFARIEDSWRLLGGILPRGPVPATGDPRALVREYRAKLGVAACPP